MQDPVGVDSPDAGGRIDSRDGAESVGSAETNGAQSSEELRGWLTGRVAVYLDIEPDQVDPENSFEAQGLDSMGALMLCDEIEDRWGLVVEPTLAWDHPTIVAMAEFLREQLSERAGQQDAT